MENRISAILPVESPSPLGRTPSHSGQRRRPPAQKPGVSKVIRVGSDVWDQLTEIAEHEKCSVSGAIDLLLRTSRGELLGRPKLSMVETEARIGQLERLVRRMNTECELLSQTRNVQKSGVSYE